MLLTTLLAVTELPVQEPMKSTGEVRAYATYASPYLLPEERLNTIYVARKLYEDGTSTTVVQTVKANTPAAFFSANTGDGRIERNRKGQATKYARRLYTSAATGESYSSLDSPFLTGQAAKAAIRKDSDLLKMLKPALDAGAVIDPLEALSFPETRAADGSWKIPMPSFGAMPPVDSMEVRPLGRRAVRLGSGREILDTFAILWHSGLVSPSGSRSAEWTPAGYLLYRPDGALAAYLPLNSGQPNPSLPLFVNTDRSRRFVHPGENWGIEFDPSRGAVVPVPVSPSEQSTVLASIKPPPASVNPRTTVTGGMN